MRAITCQAEVEPFVDAVMLALRATLDNEECELALGKTEEKGK